MGRTLILNIKHKTNNNKTKNSLKNVSTAIPVKTDAFNEGKLTKEFPKICL